MGLAGFTDDERLGVYRVLSGLLHLGDVEFDSADINKAEGSVVSPSASDFLDKFCKLFDIDEDTARNALTKRTVTTSRDVIVTPVKRAEATFARDTLAKQVYSRLFDYVVKRINAGMPVEGVGKHFIGILDISGFEYFDNNG
tara:strand:+ start:564 stop:989 length:426 start_codon:yes stop_codon:yes gene_type:complete